MNEELIIKETTEYSCTKCLRSFRREATLRSHIEMDHGDVVSDSDEDKKDEQEAVDEEQNNQQGTYYYGDNPYSFISD